MKRILIFIYAALLFAPVLDAQQSTPARPPMEPQDPVTTGSMEIESTRTRGRSGSGSDCTAKAKRSGSEKLGSDYCDLRGSGLQSALERRSARARRRRRFRYKRQSHHDERARCCQQPLSHRGARWRSQQISGESPIHSERLRPGADHRAGSQLFQKHVATKIWRNSCARIDRLCVRLSDRR